jgi:sulfide-dependent adenosine diphosphate thiazole synthase
MKEYDITPLRERDITKNIAREFYQEFDRLAESDVIIVGAGPAGLVCARELANGGYHVLLIEQMAHLGGGFWSGGYLMTKAAIASPAHEMLLKLNVPCKETGKGLYIIDAAHACAKLIGAALEAGVKLLNLTKVVDLIVREENRVEGVVVNWAPVEAMGHDIAHVDPIALESRMVVDATGHDAVTLQMLAKRNLYKPVPGNGAMWVERSEQLVLDNTGEVYPNLFVIGLAVAAVYGTPRMGPAFGAMLLSGRKGAELIKKKLAKA